MLSQRHTPESVGPQEADAVEPRGLDDDTLLDAARAGILARGWKRSTLTDVARRAGVSRMTLYRRWPDMDSLLGDLLTREWSGLVAAPTGGPEQPVDAAGLADRVARTVTTLREDALFAAVVRMDPELLLPYLLERRGRTQDALLDVLAAAIAQGQAAGAVRRGQPALLARSVLLAAHGFALSAATMTGGVPGPADDRGPRGAGTGPTLADLDAELRSLVHRYLAP